MNTEEIVEKLEAFASPAYALEWDNVGLLAGRRKDPVKKIYVALDATDDVIDKAVKAGCNFLLTHHPLLFHPVKQVNDDTFLGRRLLKLIQHGVNYYAMHTNFDVAPGGMADIASDRLRLLNREPLEPTGELEGAAYGIGAVGELESALSLDELCQAVKKAFGLSALTVYESFTGPIKRVAICPGSGKGMAGLAIERGAQVLITGDTGHHDGIDAVASGLSIIDAGHYGLEHIFIPFMADYLKSRIPGEIPVLQAPVALPCQIK